MPSPVEEIKSRTDIVEFIQQYVRLEKSGINFRGLCPFHSEKTPSFFVSPPRQIWHCFGGCGEGGDVFKFVMKIEGLEFPEALKMLAQRAGVFLKREDPKVRSERNRLYDLCECAARIFQAVLAKAPPAQNYLRERGLTGETIRDFRIGFAPRSWDFLCERLASRGFSRDEIEKAGLAVKSEDNASWYDRFRGRIMFPIMDAGGRVIGFGGRILETGRQRSEVVNSDLASSLQPLASRVESKYINTPQTAIYDKSRALYGFDKAKHEVRLKNSAVVVEGYMDCVMSHQAGVKNTIAVSGTALTAQQLTMLRRLCDTLASSFDTDEAGDSATRRSLALAAQFGFTRKIVAIPSGKDPADTVQESPDAWTQAVEHARPVVAFYIEKAFRGHSPATAEGKKKIAGMTLPFIAEVLDDIEKAHWVSELARRLGVPEDAVRKELARASSHAQTSFVSRAAPLLQQPQKVFQGRRELLEERLLALLAGTNEAARIREFGAHEITFASALHQEIFEVLSGKRSKESLARAGAERLESFGFKSEMIAYAIEEYEAELLLCRRELEKESIKEKLSLLHREIEQKEKIGASAEVSALLGDFRLLSQKLKTL